MSTVFDTVLPWFLNSVDRFKPETTNRILQQYDYYGIYDLYLGYANRELNETDNTMDESTGVDCKFLTLRCHPYNQPVIDLLTEAINRHNYLDRHRVDEYQVTANIAETYTVTDVEVVIYYGLTSSDWSAVIAGKALGIQVAIDEWDFWDSLTESIDTSYYYSPFNDSELFSYTKVVKSIITTFETNIENAALSAFASWRASRNYPLRVSGNYFANDGSNFVYGGYKYGTKIIGSHLETMNYINPLLDV